MNDDLVKRLKLWEEVFPEDLDKEEGHLYYEAADRIEQLERELSICRMAQVVMDNGIETLTAERDAARLLLKGRPVNDQL